MPIAREEVEAVSENRATSCFSSTLQNKRIQCKLSLQGLARRAMVDVNLLAQYERGEMDPSEEMERSLMRLLDHMIEEG